MFYFHWESFIKKVILAANYNHLYNAFNLIFKLWNFYEYENLVVFGKLKLEEKISDTRLVLVYKSLAKGPFRISKSNFIYGLAESFKDTE